MINIEEKGSDKEESGKRNIISLSWIIALLFLLAFAFFHVVYDVAKSERHYSSDYQGDEKNFDFYLKYRPIGEMREISVGIYALQYGKDQVPTKYQNLLITGNGLLKEQLPNLKGIPANPVTDIIDGITGERILWEGLRVESDSHPWLIFFLNVLFVWGILSLAAIFLVRIAKAFFIKDGRKFQDTTALFGLVFLLAITQVGLISIVFPDFRLK
ncbi:MAG: hypothetical protein ACYCXF_07125 [Thermoleophilia bacterium]